jgi:hypothetical protein
MPEAAHDRYLQARVRHFMQESMTLPSPVRRR